LAVDLCAAVELLFRSVAEIAVLVPDCLAEPWALDVLGPVERDEASQREDNNAQVDADKRKGADKLWAVKHKQDNIRKLDKVDRRCRHLHFCR
jgi:hypothetical protein